MTELAAKKEFEQRRRLYGGAGGRLLDPFVNKEDEFLAQDNYFCMQPQLADQFDQRDTGFVHSCYSVSKQDKVDMIYHIYGERYELVFKILLHIREGQENVFRLQNKGEKDVPNQTLDSYAKAMESIIISLPKHRLSFATGYCQAHYEER